MVQLLMRLEIQVCMYVVSAGKRGRQQGYHSRGEVQRGDGSEPAVEWPGEPCKFGLVKSLSWRMMGSAFCYRNGTGITVEPEN